MRDLGQSGDLRRFLGVVAEHHEPHLDVFVVSEPSSRALPANGGLRVGHYASPDAAREEAFMLTERMCLKHRLHATGFVGAKLVANVSAPVATMKDRIIDVVAGLLEQLNGEVYTGCDMNFDAADAARLAHASPYVLAAVDSPIDASAATGHGVYGSFAGAVAAEAEQGAPNPQSVLVHGVGAVGRTVVERALADGLEVFTVDRVPRRAALDGCTPLDRDAWWKKDVDAWVLCSGSGVIEPRMVDDLPCRLVVSGANGPFAEGAETIAAARATVVPDVMSNAGAVMVDSIERYNPWSWARAAPTDVYRMVEHRHRRATMKYLQYDRPPTFSDEPRRPCGLDYEARTQYAV
ncbi:MAG: glutamate dehydrogenase [Myxococcota bacterium]